MKINISILILTISLLALFACAEVTSSSSQVLDNGNSVIKSGSKNLWTTPTPGVQNQEYDATQRY